MTENCENARPLHGSYQLEFEGLPADVYVFSAKAGEHDILINGLTFPPDVQMEVVLHNSEAVISGIVSADTGQALTNAPVALVPDEPYRSTGARYRNVLTDRFGKFEIHDIAPGSYKLFAWHDLEGSAFRNAEFMKQFEDQGTPITVTSSTRETVNLTAF